MPLDMNTCCRRFAKEVCLFIVLRILHSHGDVIITGEGSMLGAYDHLALRHLKYMYVKFTVIRDPIDGLIRNMCMYVGTNVGITMCV